MKLQKSLVILLTINAFAISSFATLLGVNPTYPKISYLSASAFAVTYTASNQLFSVTAPPTTVAFSATEGLRPITGTKSFKIQILVDSTGALVGGVPGDDLVLSGTVTRVVGGVTNTYTGVLLAGEVTAFGFLEAGATDTYELRFNPTGGALAGLFCGTIGVQVTSGASTFNNDFTVNFNGQAKGTVGSEDITPPTIACPADIVAECHQDTNYGAGAFVSYQMPVVTDNCDPNPTVICTPPSGSFFFLPDGLESTNYVVTCVATDAAGNTNACSFNVTVEDTLPPEFADTKNPIIICSLCVPLTVTNDPSKCYATVSFPTPTAIDNCCPLTITASVTALNENGTSIPLTDLGNGILQGQFPVNVSGSNVVITTASDGRGNSTQHACAVLVVDRDPPNILCADQTTTFKPILTNAMSCIEADFDDVCIKSNSTVWFSSVIKSFSCVPGSFTVHIFDQTIELALDNTNITLEVPEAYITFSNGVPTTTTIFTNGQWITISKPGLCGNTFAAGVAWTVPFNANNQVGGYYPTYWGCLRDWHCARRHVNTATWCARFAVDKPGVVVNWQWTAVVHKNLTNDYNGLCVKPVDDYSGSCYRNSDPAGSCQKYRTCLIGGARSRGWCWGQPSWGVWSDCKRANLGLGSMCLGAVEFTPPLAVDNCGNVVPVACTPAPGAVLGPGVYPVTCVATDASGNTNHCTFNLTVLSPLQVVFDTPQDDNLNDNTAEPDDGFTDMNCPDDSSTSQYVTRFYAGDKICHVVRLLDCNGMDVTSEMSQFVTVHIDVTERAGTYSNSILINDVLQDFVCVGNPGGIMVPYCGKFQYYLDTKAYETGTVNNDRFFRSCVWVEYNSSPGVPVGLEDVILESK
jgi:hypothetical protein